MVRSSRFYNITQKRGFVMNKHVCLFCIVLSVVISLACWNYYEVSRINPATGLPISAKIEAFNKYPGQCDEISSYNRWKIPVGKLGVTYEDKAVFPHNERFSIDEYHKKHNSDIILKTKMEDGTEKVIILSKTKIGALPSLPVMASR
jgi:hypothetical protein